MKFSSSVIVMAFGGLMMEGHAFTMPTTSSTMTTSKATFGLRRQEVSNNVALMMSSLDDEVAALREQAAKVRAEAAQLEQDLGKSPLKKAVQERAAPAVVAVKERPSAEEINSFVEKIDFSSGNRETQTSALDQLKESGDFQLWNQADDKLLEPFPVSLRSLERRTQGKVTPSSLGIEGDNEVNMDDYKMATLAVCGGSALVGVLALAFLPQNIGATICYLVALIPVGFLGIGSLAPGIIADVISNIKQSGDTTDDAKLRRICSHEAGHFLVGYLCGLAVKQVTALEEGIASVEFHTTADDQEGPGFSPQQLAALSVVAMSGSVAEILNCGYSKGGQSDMAQLQNIFLTARVPLQDRKQQDMTRWGALVAYQLITKHRAKYDQLVQAFADKKSVADCVAIMESPTIATN